MVNALGCRAADSKSQEHVLLTKDALMSRAAPTVLAHCHEVLVDLVSCNMRHAHFAVQVQRDGTMVNVFDQDGEMAMQKLGNINDLKEVKIQDIAGIPIEQIQAEYAELKDPSGKAMQGKFPDHVIGFPDDRESNALAESVDYETVRSTVATQP